MALGVGMVMNFACVFFTIGENHRNIASAPFIPV